MNSTGKRGGFTLLELAVVLSLIGVILGGGLVVLTASIQTSQLNATVDRMNALDAALLSYRAGFNRLPCPADLTLIPTNVNYGEEAGWNSSSTIATGTGVCTGVGMLPQANFTGTNGGDTIAEGAVPVRALRLPDSYMYDGWGRRFQYAVDTTMTAANAFINTTVYPATCSTAAISVTDASDVAGSRTTSAVYALVSAGANGHGGYTTNGVPLNAGSTNADEQTNCHCNSSGVPNASYTPSYVQKLPTVSTASALNSFDDIVSYKTLPQLQTSATNEKTSLCPCLYISDSGNYVVRKVTVGPNTIAAYAGTGSQANSTMGVAATSTPLYCPNATMADNLGNIYITDNCQSRVFNVNASGIISLYAGNGTNGYMGNGGQATSAEMFHSNSTAFDSSNNMYISDYSNNVVRKVTSATGIITTYAGNGTAGYSGNGGQATIAELNGPEGMAIDGGGNLYIADSNNYVIRKVTSGGVISTYAGVIGSQGSPTFGVAPTSSLLDCPSDVKLDSAGNVYIADSCKSQIYKVTGGIISLYAGNGTNTYSGDGGAATTAGLDAPNSISFDNVNNLYIADTADNRIRKVTTAGIISTVAGTGTAGYSGNGSVATSAKLSGPKGISVVTCR